MQLATEAVKFIDVNVEAWQQRRTNKVVQVGATSLTSRNTIELDGKSFGVGVDALKKLAKCLAIPPALLTNDKIPEDKVITLYDLFRDLRPKSEITSVFIDDQLTSFVSNEWKVVSYNELAEVAKSILNHEELPEVGMDHCIFTDNHATIRLCFLDKSFSLFDNIDKDLHCAMLDFSTSETYEGMGILKPNFNVNFGLWRQVCANGLKIVEGSKSLIRFSKGDFNVGAVVKRVLNILDSSEELLTDTKRELEVARNKRLKEDEIILSNLMRDKVDKNVSENFPATVVDELQNKERNLFELVQAITSTSQCLPISSRYTAENYAHTLLKRHNSSNAPIYYTLN